MSYQWTLAVKYSADQPREPAGGPGGGRWTGGGGGASGETIEDEQGTFSSQGVNIRSGVWPNILHERDRVTVGVTLRGMLAERQGNKVKLNTFLAALPPRKSVFEDIPGTVKTLMIKPGDVSKFGMEDFWHVPKEVRQAIGYA